MVRQWLKVTAGFAGPCPFSGDCHSILQPQDDQMEEAVFAEVYPATAIFVVAEGVLRARCVRCDESGELTQWLFP